MAASDRRAAPGADAPDAAPDPQALLTRLEWTALRRLDGMLLGDHRALARGAGIDLAELREYQAGDDVRHIDWNVTARLDAPHVRQYVEDRDLTAWLLVDLTGSVDFGSAGRTKRMLAVEFAAALARLLTRRGGRVGAVFYRHGIEARMRPRAGRAQTLAIVKRMLAPAPDAPPLRAARGRRGAAERPTTRLAELFADADALARRRALVVAISDFVSDGDWATPLGRLARRHDVVAVRVTDPAERELPDVGLVTVEDAESGEQLLVDTGDAGFRARFAALTERDEAAVRDAFARAGVDAMELATDDDALAALLRLTVLRRRRGRMPLPRRAPATALA